MFTFGGSFDLHSLVSDTIAVAWQCCELRGL